MYILNDYTVGNLPVGKVVQSYASRYTDNSELNNFFNKDEDNAIDNIYKCTEISKDKIYNLRRININNSPKSIKYNEEQLKQELESNNIFVTNLKLCEGNIVKRDEKEAHKLEKEVFQLKLFTESIQRLDTNRKKFKDIVSKITPKDIEAIAYVYNKPCDIYFVHGNTSREYLYMQRMQEFSSSEKCPIKFKKETVLKNIMSFNSMFTINVKPTDNGQFVERDKHDIYILLKIVKNIKQRKYESPVKLIDDISHLRKDISSISDTEIDKFINEQINKLNKELEKSANYISLNNIPIEVKQSKQRTKRTKNEIIEYKKIRDNLLLMSMEQKKKYNNRLLMNTEQHFEVVAKITIPEHEQWGFLLLSNNGSLQCCNKNIILELMKHGSVDCLKVSNREGKLIFSGKNGFKVKELPLVNLYDAVDLQNETSL